MTQKKNTTALKIVFLILFIDLIGFSIIFPLFPSILNYYLQVDGENFFLKGILHACTTLLGSSSSVSPVVLFGGILGAVYSLLQFLSTPFWGNLSDKIGRRPVFIISITGLMISYLLWFISSSFTLLLVSRFIGGIMAGNISTATATVADITDSSTRSKGMATIGVAFALGFIFGPAIGGGLSLIHLELLFPQMVPYGINPFSAAALVAAVLCFINLIWVGRKFEETLPPQLRGKKMSDRSANIFQLFRPLPFPGFNLINWSHFIFLSIFSGMEFTLTFLALERFQFAPTQNAWMFVFIGFLIAGIQGGVVRKRAHSIGEKKLAMLGLIALIPGLLCLAFTTSVFLLYIGLFFLAVGSALNIPCSTTLASLFLPPEHQGKGLGIFRSMGALARVIGPLFASLLYWNKGSTTPYVVGSIFLLLPLFLLSKVRSTQR